MTSRIKFPAFAILTLLSVPCCNDHSGSEKAKALEVEIEQLTKLNSESEQTSRRLQSQVEAARVEKDRLKSEKAKLEEDRDAAAKELEKLKKDFETYKSRYKVSMKQRAPGMHLDDFAVNGASYHNVTLKELTDTYVNFSHESGVAKLSVKLLPDSLQDVLGVNIPLSDSSGAHQVMASDPKQINSSRMDDYNLGLLKAQEAKTQVERKLTEARRELNDARTKLNYAHDIGAPLGTLTRHITDQEALIAKLESQLVQADLHEYEARRVVPQLVPVR